MKFPEKEEFARNEPRAAAERKRLPLTGFAAVLDEMREAGDLSRNYRKIWKLNG